MNRGQFQPLGIDIACLSACACLSVNQSLACSYFMFVGGEVVGVIEWWGESPYIQDKI